MQNNNININEDDFIIGKGFNVDESEVKKDPKRKEKKRRSTVKAVIWISCTIAVSVVLAYVAIVGLFDFVGLGFDRGNAVQVNIPKGASTSVIAEKLEEAGVVKMPMLFRIYSKLKGYDSKYQYGLYTFDSDIGYSSIADMLVNEGAIAESVKVTIPEGTGINDYTHIVDGENKTIKGITTILSDPDNFVCSREDFIEALNEVEFDTNFLQNCDDEKTYFALEGYLFPDTYEFFSYDSKECARMVVEKMIQQTEKKITDDMYKQAEKMGYSINEILTMASIIQMESGRGSLEEMKNVAAVFYNRLDSKNFDTLGSSPTCYYGKSFANDDGRYDTYKVKGLPPGPLCSPGLNAIKAALYPASDKEGFYYFVTDKNGKFYFHKTLAEQNATIAKLKQAGNWVYETFE